MPPMIKRRMVRTTRPYPYSLRRPIRDIRNHDEMVPNIPSPYWPILRSKDALTGTPACWRKKVDYRRQKRAVRTAKEEESITTKWLSARITRTYPMKALPHKFWIIQTPQAISVRRRSTPRKQSLYEVPAETLFSNSFVCFIIATCGDNSSAEAPCRVCMLVNARYCPA